MSITTKTGDDGYTDIIDGKRLPKDHPVLECLGTVDELNAFLGEAKAALTAGNAAGCRETQNEPSTAEIITEIQKGLFSLMGVIAGMPVPGKGIGEDRLNTLIEKLESELPPFAGFAVPGANPVSAKLHTARTVCRRVERRLVSLNRIEETEPVVVQYINRLSDLLFLMAQKEQ
jgi:cob(I)alamin adenosyltransferase